MSKVRASLIHLSISALVVGTVLAIIFFLWYPAPYFSVVGAWIPVRVMIGVDLVLGPLLTLIVYRAKKPGLLFDMSVIAAIQLSALIYGVHVVYQERPYFVVHALDRFEVLAAKDVDFKSIPDAELRRKPWTGPVYVVATRPSDVAEAQELLEEVLFEGKPDIERRPGLWKKYADNVDIVVASSHDLGVLTDYYAEAGPEVARAVVATGSSPEALRFIPVIGKKNDFAMLINNATGAPVGLLELDPWPALAAVARAAEDGGQGADRDGETR